MRKVYLEMDKRRIVRKILICNMIFVILFNHFQIMGDCFNIVKAADIEVEEMNDDYEENMENDSNMEVEALKEIDYDNDDGIKKESGGQIEEEHDRDESSIENVKIETNFSIDKKVELDNGLYVQESVSIEIQKDSILIDKAIIELNSFAINGVEPDRVFLEKKYNLSVDNHIKIEESLLDNDEEKVFFNYCFELEYKDVKAFENQEVRGTIHLENTEEVYEEPISKSIESDKEIMALERQYDLSVENESLYKGFMRANFVSDEIFETKYTTISKIEINNVEAFDQIIIDEDIDKLETKDGSIILTDQIKYNQLRISKKEYDELIGIWGFIDLYQEGELLGTIDSNSTTENDELIFNFEKDVDHITIIINNPQKPGELTIKCNKAIKGDIDLNQKELDNIDAISINASARIVKNIGVHDIEITKCEKTTKIQLEETYSKMNLEMNKYVFSSEEENDISFKVSIDNNSEKYELFKNPTIEICMPDMVKKVDIEDIYLIHKNGLSIDTWNVKTDIFGRKIIIIELKGAQQKYSPGYSINETQIIINTNITVDQLAPNGSAEIELRYSNEASERTHYSVNNKACEKYVVQYRSRNGLLSEIEYSSTNENDDKYSNINSKSLVADIDSNTFSYNAQIKGKIVNNYNDTIKDVSIIGRIPGVGIKDFDGELLNNTINTQLIDGIYSTGLDATIYYSEKINCAIDDKSWIKEPTNIHDMKSFKIVIDDKDMNQGEMIDFELLINIPEKLGLNQSAYMVYSLNYTYNNELCNEEYTIHLRTENGIISEKECQTIDEIDSIDSHEPKLKIGTRATISGVDIVENQDIFEGQIIRYAILVENISDSPIRNITIEEKVNNGNMYYLEERTEADVKVYDWYEDIEGNHSQNNIQIDKLMPGEKRFLSYEVFARRNQADDVYGIISVKANDIKECSINTISGKIVDSQYELELFSSQNDLNNSSLKSNSNIDLSLRVRNNTNESKKNINIKVVLPKIVTLNDVKASNLKDYLIDYIEYEDKNVLLLVVDYLPSKTDYYYTIPVSIGKINIYETIEIVKIIAKIEENEITYLSNDYYREVEQTETIMEASITSNRNNSIVSDGDVIDYEVRVKNAGKVTNSIEIGSNIPDGINVKSAEIIEANGNKIDLEEDISKLTSYLETFTINPSEEIVIRVRGIVDSSRFNVEQNEIIYSIYSPQLEVEPYVLKINENDIVSLEWFYRNEDETDENNEDGEELEQDDDNDLEVERIQEIYTGIGKTSSNIELDYSKYIKTSSSHNDEEDTDYSEEDIIEEDDSEYEEYDEDDGDEIEEDTIEENTTDENEEITANEDYSQSEDEYYDNNENKNNEITGIAWLDINRDGINNDDSFMENVNVYLYRNDISSGNLVNKTKTEKEGQYKFEEIEDGEYYVVFEYDNDCYDTTKYSTNLSSVNELNINIDGSEKKYAVSDRVSAAMVDNVNIGLVPKSNIDFKVNTYIDSITTIKNDNIERIEFEKGTMLPKIKIAKKDISDAIVRVKYAIEVINQGNIGGYIVQLKDIIPDGFVFEESQNLNWKLGIDGSIYYLGLANDKINAGGSKTISLVLTKGKDTNNIGTFSNNVEIISTSNDMLIDENKSDNNQDTQDLVISTKTSPLTNVLWIMLVLILIAIVLLLAINKLIVNKEVKRKVIKILIVLFILVAILLLISNSFALSNKQIDRINRINELLGVSKTNNSIESYDEFKQACDGLDIFKNTKKQFILDIPIDRKIQILNKQNEITNTDNNQLLYGISSIFNTNTNNSAYKTISGDSTVYTGESPIASKIAFLGYLLEEYNDESINENDYKYNLARLLYYEQNSDSDNIVGTSYSIDYDVTNNDSGLYEKMASKYIQYKNENNYNSIEKNNSEDSSVYRVDDEYVGPFYMTAPKSSSGKYIIRAKNKDYNVGDIIASDNYIEYFSIDNRKWNGLEAEIVYNNNIIGKTNSDGKIETNIDLSNKNFLIKILNDDAKNDILEIRIVNKHNEFEATGVNFENIRNNNSRDIGSDITVLRGKQNEISSEQSWKFSSYNVAIDSYAYRVYKSENDKITDVVVDTIGPRKGFEEEAKNYFPIGVDLKDIIITCIEFKNNGKTIDGFKFTIQANDALTYLGFLESIPDSGVPEIITKSSKGNWKISKSNNQIEFTYSGKVNTTDITKIYLAYRLDSSQNQNETISEVVKLEQINVKSKNIMDLLDGSSITSNMEMFKVRESYIDINSSLYSVNGIRDEYVTFNSGDEIVIRTNISNRSQETNVDYGSIYNVQYSSNYTLADDKKIEDYLEFNGFSSVPGDFSKDGIDYVERLDDGNSGFSYDFKVNLGILPGDDINIYSSYTIKNMDKENGLTIKPNNELKSIENRNGDLEVSNVNIGPMIKGTNDIQVTDYNLTITKEVTSITSGETSVGNKTKAETGDIVNYRIKVTGTGTAPSISKPAYVIIVLDYSNSMVFAENDPYGVDDDDHGGNCFNRSHYSNGRHRNSDHDDEKDIRYGCVDRLDVACHGLLDLTTMLVTNTDNKVALTMFAAKQKDGYHDNVNDRFYTDHSSEMGYFTSNPSNISSVLNELNSHDSHWNKTGVGKGTYFVDGLTRAKNTIATAKRNNSIPSDAEVTILFFSDGEPKFNNSDNHPPKDLIRGVSVANELKQAGHTIIGVGIGKDANLDELGMISNLTRRISEDGYEDDIRELYSKLTDLTGGGSINGDDYVKVKQMQLKDTLPAGLDYVSVSGTSGNVTVSWNNGTITYNHSIGVAPGTTMNINVSAKVTRKTYTTADLTNNVYITKVISKKNTTLYEYRNRWY